MKKIVALLLIVVLVLSVGALSACNGPALDDSDTSLIIEMHEGGYGSEAMTKVARAFEVAYADKGYKVTLAPGSLTAQSIKNALSYGPTLTKTDLYLSGAINWRGIYAEGDSLCAGYETVLEDLTTMYGQKVYGEDVLFGDKIQAQAKEAFSTTNADGSVSQYAAPWCGGPNGFAYNAELFTQYGWELPRTTDELLALAAEIKSKSVYPFAFTNAASYWNWAAITWWAQLAGVDEVNDFFNAVSPNVDDGQTMTPLAFQTLSRLKAIKMVDSCIGNGTDGWAHPDSLKKDHIEMQRLLYNGSNQVVFFPSGDWCQNEMKLNGYPVSDSVGFMRVPVMSDILYDGVGNANGGKGNFVYETIRSDATLSAVIAAIDNGQTSYAGVSADDFASIKLARSWTPGGSAQAGAVIPSYATAKQAAKDFLLFLASDQAMQIIYDTTGCLIAYDTTNITTGSNTSLYATQMLNTYKNVRYVNDAQSTNPIFYNTDLTPFPGRMEMKLATTDPNDQMTGTEYFQDIVAQVELNWDNYLALAVG